MNARTNSAKTTISKHPTNSAKTTISKHPTNPNRFLVHACQEGPEAGVYYRGTGSITGGDFVTINLPNYVDKIATNFTVMVTPIATKDRALPLVRRTHDPLSVSRVENGQFTVHCDVNCDFFWHVYGTRESIDVEISKEQLSASMGPYKWVERT